MKKYYISPNEGKYFYLNFTMNCETLMTSVTKCLILQPEQGFSEQHIYELNKSKIKVN